MAKFNTGEIIVILPSSGFKNDSLVLSVARSHNSLDRRFRDISKEIVLLAEQYENTSHKITYTIGEPELVYIRKIHVTAINTMQAAMVICIRLTMLYKRQ